jgi:hypothetical protein
MTRKVSVRIVAAPHFRGSFHAEKFVDPLPNFARVNDHLHQAEREEHDP